MPASERAGQRTLWITLHDGQRRLPPEAQRQLQLGAPTLLVVDGYEQLGRWSRFRLRRLCRRRGLGLLVTAHELASLPELYRTPPMPNRWRESWPELLAGEPCPWTSTDLAERLARHGGNLRETLFELYDLYEQRRPAAGRNLT